MTAIMMLMIAVGFFFVGFDYGFTYALTELQKKLWPDKQDENQ
jgi:hypothetical protein